MSENDFEIENIDIKEELDLDAGRVALIPEKSRERYINTYNSFKKWCEENNAGITEKVLLEYFVQRNEKLKSPGSLWAEYSMLKTTIFLYDCVDISKFLTLVAYLKRKNVGYKPKKASVFTREDMSRFLIEAPDKKFLIHKVAMILGVAGACRREDLYNMTIKDIEDHGTLIIVKIPNTKTNIQRTFTVTNGEDERINYLDIYRKYLNLRPSHAQSLHLFLNYQNGKCNNQVVGKNTIGSWPSKIAAYLKLPYADQYNGHSFRRTSTTFLVNKGVDVLGLEQNSGWKSSAEAEGYIDDSLQNKMQFAETSLQEDNESSYNVSADELQSSVVGSVSHSTFYINTSNSEKGPVPITISNCNNCTFHFHINK